MTRSLKHDMLLFMLLALIKKVGCDSVIGKPDVDGKRTLLQLIWSCSATIFVCTWLAVHPSVPGREGSQKAAEGWQ